ncbi:hypothetical protein M501DRAFT_930414 [Patellaria atrata CBS 101060]|uniref:Uncharacterized protein n=1 Tax=Patellaria atrata CBS 101060 TaxID=1346257 RepID=A0A9P4VRE0_9PEZI|nr:hypothetical protein M501DRAFT_930414 [Patellaria atrata CBS 101060]
MGLNPLHVSKRRYQGYTSPLGFEEEHDGDIGDYDVEKSTVLDEDDYLSSPTTSSYSSRAASGSQAPMIPRRTSSPRRHASAYTYRAPRRYGRYFTIALGSTLILFILSLVRMSWSSARNVRLGLSKPPPKPPVWEAFPFLKRYHGGIRTLVSQADNIPEYPGLNEKFVSSLDPKITNNSTLVPGQTHIQLPASEVFDPYPDYKSAQYKSEYGEVYECFLDAKNTIRVPMLRAYNGVPKGMPKNVMGSYETLGLREDVCFERFGKLGPYGLGYSRKIGGSSAGMEGDREGIEQIWQQDVEVDFRTVRWADVQTRCFNANRHRFKESDKSRGNLFQGLTVDDISTSTSARKRRRTDSSLPGNLGNLPRTAVLLRTWWDYQYDDEDLFFLRSLLAELSILSGGEYTLHFLVHVKDDNKQIWADEEVYQEVLNNALPEEFRGMGTLWSERQMGLIYGGVAESFFRDLPVHGVYRSAFMPVQYFAHQHPEYDFFWHWEMDVRYTGNMYHLFDKVSSWAKKQPRKFLWERNGRFYVPEKHGSWDKFMQLVELQTEHGTNDRESVWAAMGHTDPKPGMEGFEKHGLELPVWGPVPPLDDELETTKDQRPNVNFKTDQYQWGSDEEADLITFSPLFDPEGSGWILSDDVTGYNTSKGFPPRRVSIGTASRLSRRLLETMHRETAFKRHTMSTEMWPGSVALHHGLKAVYAPHPIYVDRRWPIDYLADTFNAGRNGASGGSRLSVFGEEKRHNFRGTTWFYDAGFAPNLWKRWLGYKVDNDGGEQWEMAQEGRMCLPAMLLHPIKHVDMIYEHPDQRTEQEDRQKANS